MISMIKSIQNAEKNKSVLIFISLWRKDFLNLHFFGF